MSGFGMGRGRRTPFAQVAKRKPIDHERYFAAVRERHGMAAMIEARFKAACGDYAKVSAIAGGYSVEIPYHFGLIL